MLDRYKLMKEIHAISDNLFLDFSGEKNLAQQVWEKITQDPTFAYKVREITSQWIIPSWQGKLDDVYEIEKKCERYTVLSVDGSQIYPDRHQGTACHLINIGSVQLHYGVPGKRVVLDSEPYVFVDFDPEIQESPAELVNCRRQELEFIGGYELAKSIKNSAIPQVLLFDGSLIFWHLESKSIEIKNKFITSYLTVMQQLYETGILMAGYISLPKSKEIVNLIRVYLCDFIVQDCERYKEVNHIVDAQVVSFYLQPFTRTTLFKNASKVTKYYPEYLHPHFFYLHIGHEIVRIEIPAWIAEDVEKVDLISTIIADQSIKGMGYPVALAEAHEQAVVKSPDREFFYQMIHKVSIDKRRIPSMSQKVRKKLGMGI